jgi:hypothetical protein
MSEMRTPESPLVWSHSSRPPPVLFAHGVANVLSNLLGQVGKVLGERWKALNEKQRAPYEAKAAADKKRYEEAKEKYNVSCCMQVTLA